MPIQVLSNQLASQIAAGEVVERPSSVAKELIENAIDAGAKTINVDIRNGGRNLIQVADDGAGIPAAELEVAFMRHATSKLQTADDLNTIYTLGFRGEALAAIAAVSQVTAVTRAKDETAGTRLVLDGGHKVSQETVGAPQGTVIAVENLFYNMPARLKFLKSVTTERRLIDEYVTRYALAYPDIRFRLTHDNRITFQSNGSGQLKDVLVSVYGPDTARDLLEINSEAEEPDTADMSQSSAKAIQVSGYAGPPRLNWANRTHITLFVNGRWIKDNRLTYAVIQAYHTLLPVGRYPLAVLFLTMPPELVDVNVHPAKTEVRFRQSNAAFGAVQRAVRQTIVAHTPIRDATHFASFQHTGWAGAAGHETSGWQMGDPSNQSGLALDWSPGNDLSGPITGTADPNNEPMVGGGRIPIMRVIGQVGAAYIITEGPDGLYLIDQHAAHERILYEQFMAAWKENGQQSGIVSQGLVTGAAVQLAPAQADLLNEHLELMSQLGFQVEPFGPNTFMVRSLPAIVAKLDPARALMDVIEDLERGDEPLQSKIEARIILRVCKSAAVKAGQTLSRQEMEAMIHQLENCQNPHSCPHGRPTLIHLSVAQLAREFGRV